jgi:hypothetical protein
MNIFDSWRLWEPLDYNVSCTYSKIGDTQTLLWYNTDCIEKDVSNNSSTVACIMKYAAEMYSGAMIMWCIDPLLFN